MTSPEAGTPVPAAGQVAVTAAITSIAQPDPAFNLDALLAEAQQAFWLVGQAHAKCQPELCVGVLSGDLANRERATIEEACRKEALPWPPETTTRRPGSSSRSIPTSVVTPS